MTPKASHSAAGSRAVESLATRRVTAGKVVAVLGIVVEVFVVVSLYLTLPTPVPRDIAGTVHCLSGRPVVRVWVEGFSGGSWYADLSWPSADPAFARYAYRLPSGGQYEVRVGCGGSPGDWFTTNYSGYVDDSYRDFVCDDPPTKGVDGRCR